MHEPLTGDSPHGGAPHSGGLAARGRRALRLRGGEGDDALIAIGGGCCCCLLTVVLIFTMFIGRLSPNSYAIIRNGVSGNVGTEVYRGGMHVMFPWQSFLVFPATRQTIEFSRTSQADQAPVLTRTGADPDDPDSGGQPIQISCAFQLTFVQEQIRDVYLAFGSLEAAIGRYTLLSSNMVGNTAQKFTPQDFWMRRKTVSDNMTAALNRTLWEHGHVTVRMFEIMNVDFAGKFEDSITAVQVAAEQWQVNHYNQHVTEIAQQIEVMKAVTNATIANISAKAHAHGKVICANSTRDAFNLKQTTKAAKYTELQTRLKLNAQQMTEYFKIKSLQAQGQTGKIIVGVPSVDASAGAGSKGANPEL